MRKRITTSAIYGAFLLVGMALTVFGPTIPYLMEDYKIDMGRAGLLITFMAGGRMLSVIISGVISDRLGRKPILITGTCLLTMGLFSLGILSWYPAAVFFIILAGIGHGMVDTSASAAIADIHNEKMSSALNIAHMFFGIGCLVGPLIAGTILTFTDNWRIDYIIKGFVGMGVTGLLVIGKFEKQQTTSEIPSGKMSFFASSSLILLGMVMFLYSGVGHTLNTWINKYMGDVVSFSTFFAAGSIAVYNMGLTSGRLVCGLIGEKIRYKRLILTTSVCSLGAITIALFSNTGIIIILGLALTGFFFGGLFPTVIAVSGRMYPDQKGTVAGLLITMAALGSMTVPAACGFVAQIISFESTMKSMVILVVILVGTALLLQRNKG